ncbi:MAG: hypothetical protein WDN72_03335 [Alphaproteobacteria bacterium]
MYNDGYITQVEEQRAMRTPIVTRTRAKSEVADADFFAEEVRRTLSTSTGRRCSMAAGCSSRPRSTPTTRTMPTARCVSR